VYPEGLISMSLSVNHDISFIKNENFDLLEVKELVFQSPVKDFSRSTEDDMFSNL
jgi:hypothetical protein